MTEEEGKTVIKLKRKIRRFSTKEDQAISPIKTIQNFQIGIIPTGSFQTIMFFASLLKQGVKLTEVKLPDTIVHLADQINFI